MFSGIFIDRPRLAVVISLVITIAGLVAMQQIPVAQFPNIVPPQVCRRRSRSRPPMPVQAPKSSRQRWVSRSSPASSASIT